MPELPEVEILRQYLAPMWVGRELVEFSVADERILGKAPLGWASFPEASARITHLRRVAKHLVASIRFEGHPEPRALVFHFGMTGKLRIGEHSNARLTLTFGPTSAATTDASSGARFAASVDTFSFVDPRRWGWVGLYAHESAMRLLNVEAEFFETETHVEAARHVRIPEPWPTPLNAERLGKLFAKRRAAIKTVLMNNKLLGGIGNILAAEGLHRAGIAPTKSANALNHAELARLSQGLWAHCEETIRLEGGGEVVYVNERPKGSDDTHFRVYGREGKPCTTCGNAVVRTVQQSRATFWCPTCQS